MKEYEIICLISPETAVEELNGFLKGLAAFIEEDGGRITATEGPLKQNLRYPLKKKKEAYFFAIVFGFEPKNLIGLEKKLKAEPRIIRYLIFAKEAPHLRTALPLVVPEVKSREVIIEEIGPSLKPSISRPGKKVELEEIEETLEEILNQ